MPCFRPCVGNRENFLAENCLLITHYSIFVGSKYFQTVGLMQNENFLGNALENG